MMEPFMYAIDVAVIGAGQAGLAMSHCLSNRGIDHVVFERGDIGARWQSHAWDSLRLLTPNWLNGLPGSPYYGDCPDGFMRHNEFLARLQSYAAAFSAPVMAQTEVLSVLPERDAFRVSTSRGSWRVRAVVVATGQCDIPFVPSIARSVTRRVLCLHSSQYRSPSALPLGGVLVVGASASGVLIADELQRSGRKVTLAVGQHARAPRTWRGRDIFWWMDSAGILAERTRDLPDADAAKRQPALQLAGRPDRSNVDLRTLQELGVRLAGRVVKAEGDRIAFSDDLPSVVTSAQAKLERLLARIDTFASFGHDCPHDEIAPVDLPHQAPLSLSTDAENIRTVVWATGYRRAFPWLRVPGAVGPDGEIAQVDGATLVPGLYALGFRLLRKRDSHFIGGVGSDALVLAQQLTAHLRQCGDHAA
jgi:putative flavoprotein involved in K+ transport